MSYEIDPNNRKCIRKANSKKRVGCTKGSVKKYLAALHVNVNESEGDDLEWAEDVLNSEVWLRWEDMNVGDYIEVKEGDDYYKHVDGNMWKVVRFKNCLTYNPYNWIRVEVPCMALESVFDKNGIRWLSGQNVEIKKRSDLKFKIVDTSEIYKERGWKPMTESEENDLEWAQDVVNTRPLEFNGKEILIDIRDLNVEERDKLVDVLRFYMLDAQGDIYWGNDCIHDRTYRETKYKSISLHCGIEDQEEPYKPVKGLVCCLPYTYKEDSNKENIIPMDGRLLLNYNLNESEDLEWAEDIVNSKPIYRFRDLVFKPHHLPGAVRARFNFPNGHYISVVGGSHLYGDGVDTFEIWGSDADEPEGYLTKVDVTNRMIELQELPHLEGEGSFMKEPITESEENDLEWVQDTIKGLDHYEDYRGEYLKPGTILMIDGHYDGLTFEKNWAKVIRKTDEEYDDTYLLVFPKSITDGDYLKTHCGETEEDEESCDCIDLVSSKGKCWYINLEEMNSVQVFPKLSGFLNENKYGKPLLTEGRYDAITRKAVKDIMQVVTTTQGQNEDLIQVELPGDVNPNEFEYLQDGMTFSIELHIQRQFLYNNRSTTKESEAYFVNTSLADGDDNIIMMSIVVDPNWEPRIYEKLFYKLQEDIRHEIEHLTQMGYYRVEDRPISKTSTANLKTVYGHHKNKIEVPALVHGFYRRAKLEKRPIDEVMIEDLDSEIEKGNLSKKQAENLLKIWVDYSRKNLPTAIYSQQ